MPLDFRAVKQAAHGRWLEIFLAHGIGEEFLTGKQTPCPGCGGTDRFKLKDDNGGVFYCSWGGEAIGGDGFDLLCHMGMTKGEALKAVADHLGIKPNSSPEARAKLRMYKQRQRLIELDEIIRHEAHCLLQVVSARCVDRELAKDRKYRASHPEWQPMPLDPFDREIEAARKLYTALRQRYHGTARNDEKF